MGFTDDVKRIGDLNHTLVHADLRLLSNIETEHLKLFWQEWLHFPSERRVEIAHAINELGEDNIDLDFRPLLRALLSDKSAEVRVAAIDGLWEDESEGTMDRLIHLLGDEAGPVRAAAAVGLATFAYRSELGELSAGAGQRLYAAFIRMVSDPEQPLDVRRRVIEALGYFAESKEAQAEIGRAYAHSEITMRESAVRAMGRSMRPTWFPYIERELKSQSPAMRYEAARAVGELGEDGRGMLAALLPLVDDDDGEIALAAIWSLGQVGGQSAKRVLQRLARTKDDARRLAADEALEELALEDL